MNRPPPWRQTSDKIVMYVIIAPGGVRECDRRNPHGATVEKRPAGDGAQRSSCDSG